MNSDVYVTPVLSVKQLMTSLLLKMTGGEAETVRVIVAIRILDLRLISGNWTFFSVF